MTDALSSGRQLSPLEEFIFVSSRLSSLIPDLSVFAEHGISPANWTLLVLLENCSLSSEKLAQRVGLSRQRVSVQVKELEAKNLIEIVQQDDGDRRARIVCILPQGRAALRNISASLEPINERFGSKMISNSVKAMLVFHRLCLQDRRARAGRERLVALNSRCAPN